MALIDAIATESPESLQNTLALLEASSVIGCVVLGDDGEIHGSNALFRHWLVGRAVSLLEQRNLADWLPRLEDQETLQQAVQSNGISQVTIQLKSSGGSHLSIVGDLIPLSDTHEGRTFAGFFHETVMDQTLSAGMERSARLEALGSLTSGVAHDFNNLLTILTGNLSLVAEELRGHPRQFAKLKSARDAARRGGELIKRLLSFARQEPVAADLINPTKVIADIAPLIERALSKRISFELDLEKDVDPIQGNSAQLESVIVNLAVNARDAIDDEGCVKISVSSANVDESDGPHRGLSPGPYLRIEVSDDGDGIAPDTIDHIFEPFFTTKADGRGSGLGLSMVKLYAEQFGGTPQVVSRPGVGTTVWLWFPTSSGTIEDSAAMTMPVAALPSGDELVVVLASDDSLGSMLEQILAVLGYQCRLVDNLGAASDLFQEALPELLIVDDFDVSPLLEAQATSGRHLSRILVLRGDGAEDATQSHPVLHKPFTLPDLAVAVREALDTGR